MRGYKEIHVRGLKLLKPGGVLATFCCSHHVGTQLFLDSVLSGIYGHARAAELPVPLRSTSGEGPFGDALSRASWAWSARQ